ncbi:glycoside hydrolase/phage tail family protein [Marinovum sp. 2_MG-2023]|uniref:baseplate multidomain protein megatron n=1 Tax=unclassified Marinovum TaxID=2647166 RepID=UPI0026E38DFA|nr:MULTISPECIES: glycoside hydrolase/phage tail family protein [unclassified Marinovum]MDO6731011.1 glycoside hydrolase/phage tail family protein [Marinovum sp. 2_MG-2023]MDO6778508.1 glycoside hydrolase/phage tail family protein [Marinovum sp. 1_MG-2023]
MATIVLSAAGAALGSAVGGTFLGLSLTAVGRFIGATVGRAIDQRLMGQGSEVVVEGNRIDRFRVNRAGEGAPIARSYGRMRMAGHVLWASNFTEHVNTKTSGGSGKGAPSQPKVKTTTYSYTVNLAIAVCEGEITNIGRIWADGEEVPRDSLNLRVYTGSEDQLPDPKIEAIEGPGAVPAYRGTAYVVLEDLDLSEFGNRVPQFSFEVSKPAQVSVTDGAAEVPHNLCGVALVPGTGEYALATTPVKYKYGPGDFRMANVNSPAGKSDIETSLDQLTQECPNMGATSLIVSWFGNDLRAGQCQIQPKVEQSEFDGKGMAWRVSGLERTEVELVARDGEDRPVYGGAISDGAVLEGIRALKEREQSVMFYPFILMDQLPGNGLPDPYSDASDQPVLPWRGRITTERAPGQSGSTDGTAAAEAEVAAFFGTAQPGDFTVLDETEVYEDILDVLKNTPTLIHATVDYSGPQEWSYRRFILHYAALCAASGGVDAFCIGSEMRGLTQIRGADGGFPAVAAMIQLAADVRQILGPNTKIGYAADWSEYFGYHPQDGSGDVLFHLDPLWANSEIDFVGIDNYMPLSDWRDGKDHADAGVGSIYNLDYLRGNVAGGEGYDWYYPTPEAMAAQRREPITDGAHDEPWIYRYKDIRNWWSNPHHNRIAGERQANATEWVPQGKPIWFTEFGCAAIDKGTNQPNKFLDPKSSESSLPKFSDGRRDELIQRQYLRAVTDYWGDATNNPVSEEYGGAMVDMDRAFVWAWDTRPYPYFPANSALWTDSGNYARGHWMNGRASAMSLARLVEEICLDAGVPAFDVSDLRGFIRGYTSGNIGDMRTLLQPLMLHFGFDAVERAGVLHFIMRAGRDAIEIDADLLAINDDLDGTLSQNRSSEAEMAGRVRLDFIQSDGDYETIAEEAVMPDEATHTVSRSEVPLVLTRAEGRQTVERWLAEARVAREQARFALPPSRLDVAAGDVVSLPEGAGRALYRVDRIEVGREQIVEAVRIEPEVYQPVEIEDDPATVAAFVPPVPVLPLFLDLPLLTGDEVPHAPHLAVAAKPWPGSVALYDSAQDSNYQLNDIFAARATFGVTQTPLFSAPSGIIDRGDAVQVKLTTGAFSSIDDDALLAGGNLCAIGDGTPGGWELFQFRDAELVDVDTWMLSHRLRGQLGTDALMPASWPEGAYVVLIDGAPEQINLPSSARRIARHYRVGPAQRPVSDPSYEHEVHAFDGNGLRPYSPVHLKGVWSSGDLTVTWVRRTRIDGDSWDLAEVPLGEANESYLLRVMDGITVLREVTLNTPMFAYSAAMQSADGAGPGVHIEVAQISDVYGPGPFARWQV